MKKILKVALSFMLVISLFSINSVFAAEKEAKVNLALNKTATASDQETADFNAIKAFDGVVDYTNGGKQSRWASNTTSATEASPKWLKVDLGSIKTINEFIIEWERKNATHYSIQISNDDNTWSDVYTSTEKPSDYSQKITLDAPVTGRYVKLVIYSYIGNCPVRNTDGSEKAMNWNTVSVFEFGVYKVAQVTDENLAIANGVTATAEGYEDNAASVAPEKAIDGKENTRWASSYGQGAKYLQVDLQTEKVISSVNIHWERKNATQYSILASSDGTHWSTIMSFSEKPEDYYQAINFNNAIEARYLKLAIDTFDATGAPENGNSVNWPTVSVYEFEIYSIPLSIVNVNTVASSLQAPEVTKDMQKLPLPSVPEGYTVNIEGVDYDELASKTGEIYQPLVTSQLRVNLKVSDGKKTASKEVNYTIPGKIDTPKLDNKPTVIPELREWAGEDGNFKISETSQIVVNPKYYDELKRMAVEFKNDYQDILKKDIRITKGTKPATGDFYFTLGSKDAGLHKEGYLINIADSVHVEASDKQGAYWATRTILQILKQTNGTIAKGTTRDYPKFDLRGFMLDVGRKPFSLDYLKATVKNMAWYKMNDFQVHLSDNYIWIEDYVNDGIDPRDPEKGAYSGFRLESTIVGKNGVALTSTDQYYTKQQFRDYIKDARELGIDIVPEIDTPAHSLALTKVRPDLALDTTHPNINRAQDHLNLSAGKYDESIAFVKEIFDEYLTDKDPVFDDKTIVNIGTDEYDGTLSNQFRKFTDDMIEYIQSNDRIVRLWGSLSARTGSQTVRSENVQMNIWNTGWANPADMLKQGFNIINMQDSYLYMVPSGKNTTGGYQDHLNNSSLYSSWVPNKFGNTVFSTTNDQILGASYAIWNDNVDRRDAHLSQEDIFTRFFESLPTISEKTWGEGRDKTFDELKTLTSKTGYAPNSEVYGDPVVPATDIELNTSDRQMKTGDTFDVKATVQPNNATFKDVIFKSSNDKVATIDQTGHLIAVSAGTATITVSTEDKSVEFKVTVNEKEIILNDDKNNVRIESNTGVIPADTQLMVEHLTSGQSYEAVKTALSSIGTQLTVYDLNLLSQGIKIQPKGNLKISLPIPANYDVANIELYLISHNQKTRSTVDKIKLSFEIIDNQIVFETDELGTIAIVEKNKTPDVPDDNNDKPNDNNNKPSDNNNKPGDNNSSDKNQQTTHPEVNTGDMTNIALLVCLLTLSAGVYILFKKRKI